MQTAARLALLCGFLCLGGIRAYAADQGDCGTPEAMTAKVKAEGQRTFASADQQEQVHSNIPGEKVYRLRAIFFTTNADQSVGYMLRSDKDSSQRATEICVYVRLANLRLFDARKADAQTAAMLKASDEGAKKHCTEIIKAGKLEENTCASFNESMRRFQSNGERVIFQGFNLQKQSDASYKKDGTLTTVTGNLTGSLADDPSHPIKGIVGGVFYTSLPDGATIINMGLVYPQYTPYGVELLQNGAAH